MRVLAVDPGLTRCGLGVVEAVGTGPGAASGRRVRMVAVGVVRTPSADPVPQRLLAVAEGLERWLDEHAPDVVAVERVFAQANVRSVMGTAQAAGLVLVAAARRGLPVAMHTPSEVKAAVTGSGRADKEQVTAMVTRILGLDSPPRPADAADALALALCHLWRGSATTRLEAAAHGALVTGRRNGYAEAARAAARRPVARRPR
ncbi:crossover junction endodeoxyribonuclease RuvC [Kineococcus sp. SYSU DK018]|uniref:crossover junction endodeoxyribonuclease RuvC n=1 Tax=Kineococcus sp. SYSU DK018 TaxID=3383139 RepID=UPI003D7DF7FE